MNSFDARTHLEVGGKSYEIHALNALSDRYNLDTMPYSLKILLENLLRHEDGESVTREDIEALANWDPKAQPSKEIAFTPARVLLQDFTGVPAVVDLATMREAMRELGADPDLINPLSRADLVIDHSVMVDHYGRHDALDLNSALEYKRNKERYQFLRWGQEAFKNFSVVPPETGIVHQVNLEYLAQVVYRQPNGGVTRAYPDTLVGTDSHTTMINGVGVLGWGVGGIEAEAAMLGQAIPMLIPRVTGFRLVGELAEGATATDLVLTVVQMLREQGVVGNFVEFFGDGLDHLTIADQATISNMCPEYGATVGIFPVDRATLDYLNLTGRGDEQIALVEAYARKQGMFRDTGAVEAVYTDVLELDLGSVEPSLAGPKRPQDRIGLSDSRQVITRHLRAMQARRGNRSERKQGDKSRFEDEGGATAIDSHAARHNGACEVTMDDETFTLSDGDIVIAAITSCTNTSNPAVIVGAGLLAKNAKDKGIKVKPWVKTSLAPGSQVVTQYLEDSNLLAPLEDLGFDVVGYGCTTCIGNSGPLREEISGAIHDADLIACSVLSGNRNFEGRIHQDVRMNFLASPPLVVAYALAGTMNIDPYNDPIARDADGNDVYMKDIWPSKQDIDEVIEGTINRKMFQSKYADVFKGDTRWNKIATPEGTLFDWDEDSTYIRKPPFFEGMPRQPEALREIKGARVLVKVGDSITTDHISPAGSIAPDSPAGKYLLGHGISQSRFNSYGSRRGNHEVMMRGTFANIRLRNEMAPGTEGGWTRLIPGGKQTTIYEAAMQYQNDDVPLIVIAGKEYGTGSSRDWAAKGTRLLGVRAVIAESYERIHRSNLIGMGVLPLQFEDGTDRTALSGEEEFDIEGLDTGVNEVTVVAHGGNGERTFKARVRIDTPKEWEYYSHGGILQYVLRQLAADDRKAAKRLE
ncbi:MAG: Aconitate hydratase A [Gammaproteobacteria bacterium]|nr:Aconitate hydratase A [Gammaproteobacteria bacterium]